MTNTPNKFTKSCDVLIIGGGIQGCGVAQAMAARGYSTVLVEKNDLGSGTSSKSSKLIHGGLRYLESAQFSLVRKSLRERRLLCELAPELISLKRFYIPIYRSARLSSLKVWAGLFLYSLLGGFNAHCRFRKLNKSEWNNLSGLTRKDLVAVYEYSDAQTNDQALTRAVANSAIELGAMIHERCEFVSATQLQESSSPGNIGVTLRSGDLGDTELRCSVLVNASGPWVEETQTRIGFSSQLPSLSLVQGSHIELDHAVSEGIIYVESPEDRRPVFIMPGIKKGLLVGTTERAFTGSADESKPHQQEIEYLHNTLLHYFPDYSGGITNSWSGLRVLPGIEDKGAATLMRPFSKQARDTIFHVDNESAPNLLTLCGGKLTTYRTTAESVADMLEPALLEKGIAPKGLARSTSEIKLWP